MFRPLFAHIRPASPMSPRAQQRDGGLGVSSALGFTQTQSLPSVEYGQAISTHFNAGQMWMWGMPGVIAMPYAK